MYQEGLKYLEEKEFPILSVTIDGRRGIADVFKAYPVQICQFHIQKRITTLLTNNPRSLAGKELYQINKLFIHNRLTEQELGKTLALYTKRHKEFLNELNEDGKYQHSRIITALRTYKNQMKSLFIYQRYPQLNIPNTTNHLDGGVNTKIKEFVRTHRGLKKTRRNKLISRLLNNLGDRNSY